MSREIKADFILLTDFIRNYQISDVLANSDFNTYLSQQHKKYFAYLTLLGELQSKVDIAKFKPKITSNQYSYLKESCSDLGIAFFISFHGGYKGSKLLIRSSIETFFKGYCQDQIKGIDKESNLFSLFQKIKDHSYFKQHPAKDCFDKIYGHYKLLCKDVHTASGVNMAGLSALNYFPSFDKKEADKINKVVLNLIPYYLVLLCYKYNVHYHDSHYNNKQIIITSIPKEFRPIIHNLK
jgi:hypothetical protein